jgi:transposase
MSEATLLAIFKEKGIVRKKLKYYAGERDIESVKLFDMDVAAIDVNQFVFFDETSFTYEDCNREFGYCVKGKENRISTEFKDIRDGVNVLIAISATQVFTPMMTTCTITSDLVTVYISEIAQLMNPVPQDHSVLVWDNAGPHNRPAVEDMLSRVGARVLPLPAYSPDRMPIEMFFGILKESFLRKDPTAQLMVKERQPMSEIVRHLLSLVEESHLRRAIHAAKVYNI